MGARDDDGGQGRGGADAVAEFLRRDHHRKVDGPAWAGVVTRVDDGFVGDGGACAAGAHGGDVDAAGRKGVLQHCQHGGVGFTRDGWEIGAVVAGVEVEFYLAQRGGGVQAAGEDRFAGVTGPEFGILGDRGGERGQSAGGDKVRVGEVEDGRGDGGSWPGARRGVGEVGGGGESGVAAQVFVGFDRR